MKTLIKRNRSSRPPLQDPSAPGLYASLSLSGEKALSRPLVIAGKAFFTTYVPEINADETSCSVAEGAGRLHSINVLTGESVYATKTLGDGIPSRLVLFFRNLGVPPGVGDPDGGVMIGTCGGATIVDPKTDAGEPELFESPNDLAGSRHGISRRSRGGPGDRVESGLYWYEDPES